LEIAEDRAFQHCEAKLAEFQKEHRETRDQEINRGNAKMTFDQAATILSSTRIRRRIWSASKFAAKCSNFPRLPNSPRPLRRCETDAAVISKNCADLTEGLPYSGMRIGEAGETVRADVDFVRGRIRVVGDPEDATKNGEIRYVPLIPQARELFTRMFGEKIFAGIVKKLHRR
jgi:integrase